MKVIKRQPRMQWLMASKSTNLALAHITSHYLEYLQNNVANEIQPTRQQYFQCKKNISYRRFLCRH